MRLRRYRDREGKDKDLAEELASHLAHQADMNQARGLSPEEAQRQARLRFGNPRTVRERVWRYRSLAWFEDLRRDLHFALRSLKKSPGFAIIAILVIAVGIAVNTAVFSVINTVLLRPLTYPDPQALVSLVNITPRGNFPGASIPKFNVWRQQSGIFQQVAAYDFGSAGLNLTGGDHPQQVEAIHVSADYFAMFGAPVAAGRTFTAEEDSPNGGHVVVLSYALWKSRYGGNPNIVGTPIQIEGQPYLVVGVIGKGFVTESPADLWVPYQFDLNSKDMVTFFTVAARLRPGVTIPQANARLGLALQQYRRMYGESLQQDGGFGVVSLQQSVIGDTRFPLMVLMGAVGFVLLIACANVANLLLARAASRKREFATRAALGAGRGQIIRQLLIESLTLSLSGGFIGLVLGYAGVRFLLSLNPGDIPRIGEDGSGITLDIHVLLFTLGISVLTGIVFGLVPAISASRPNLVEALNDNGGRAGIGVRGGKLRSALVVGEMALTVVLVVGAGLLIRTFYKLLAVDTGFTTHNVIAMSMAVSGDRFQKTAPLAQVIREGTDRLLTLPGVVDVGVTNCLPMAGGFGMMFDVVGRPKGNAPFTGGAGFSSISYGYFNTLKIPLIRGRVFTKQDDVAAPLVVVINEAMAKQYWPKGADPLKDRIIIGAGAGPAFAEGPRQVIGIVGNTHDGGPNAEPFPVMYIPLAQMPDLETALNSRVAPMWWIVRSQVDPHTLVPSIESALRQASGGLPVAHIRTMDEIEARNIARQRLNMLLLTVFGSAGLLMAAIGVYGVMSYSVTQRNHELGVRMALGAQASNLRNMVIGQGMLLTIIGVLIGSAGAFWLTRFLASFLFGVKPLDPVAFVATPLLLCLVALASTWVPAKRATHVDPITALRIE